MIFQVICKYTAKFYELKLDSLLLQGCDVFLYYLDC